MKKNLFSLALIILSAAGSLFAQRQNQTPTDKLFDSSPGFFRYDFFINLGKGNKIELQLNMVSDLDYFTDIDSLLRGLQSDLRLLQDSLSNPVTAKRIDYVIDNRGQKKIRIQQNSGKGTSYLIQGSALSLLKVEQDTIVIPGSVAHFKNGNDRVMYRKPYLLRIFLNNLDELAEYTDGRLNKAIAKIKEDAQKNRGWWDSKSKWLELSASYDATKEQTTGSINEKYIANDYLRIMALAGAGNYKNYFVLSLSLGAIMHFSSRQFQKEFGLYWEPNFFFQKNANGSLSVYRNDFLTATFMFGQIQDNNPHQPLNWSFTTSLGYLIHREGEFVDPHSFRLGLGGLNFRNNSCHLEPAIYFNNFFRGVTPGLRFTVDFGPHNSSAL